MDDQSAGLAVVVALPAEIDVTNCDGVAASLAAAIDSTPVVIADLTGTTFCDSSGMQMLLAAHHRAAAAGSALRLAVRPGDAVARVLEIAGLDSILDVYASVADAMPADAAPVELAE